MPMAVELRKHKQELQAVEQNLQAKHDINRNLKTKLCALQSKDESWKSCVIELAKMKLQADQIDYKIREMNEDNNYMIARVEEEKERQNNLMQKYYEKKKLEKEQADTDKILLQQNEKAQKNMETIDKILQKTLQQEGMDRSQQQERTKKIQLQEQMERTLQQEGMTRTLQQGEKESVLQDNMIRALNQQEVVGMLHLERMERIMQKKKLDRPLQQDQIKRPLQQERIERMLQEEAMERTLLQEGMEKTLHQQPLEVAQQGFKIQQKVDRCLQQQSHQKKERLQQVEMEKSEQIKLREQMEKLMNQQYQLDCPIQERQQLESPQKRMGTLQHQNRRYIEEQQLYEQNQMELVEDQHQMERAQQNVKNIHQNQQNKEHNVSWLTKVPMISTPVTPFREVQLDNARTPPPTAVVSTPYLIQYQENTQPLDIPQPEIESSCLYSQPINTTETLSQPASDLIQYESMASQKVSQNTANIQNEKAQEIPIRRSMPFQMPSLYQPPPSPHFNTSQAPSILRSFSDTLTSSLQLKQDFPDCQSKQQSLQSPIHANFNDSNIASPPNTGNNINTTEETMAYVQIDPEEPEHITEGSTSQGKLLEEVVSVINTLNSTYEVQLPEDSQSHKNNVSNSSSPGFVFTRRPMFDTLQGLDGQNQEENNYSSGQVDNPFFQSFFQLGENSDSNMDQSSTTYDSKSPKSQIQQHSFGKSLFVSSEVVPSTTLGEIFMESQLSSFQSEKSLFSGGGENDKHKSKTPKTPEFQFSFGGEQQDSNHQSPGLSFLAAASSTTDETTQSTFSLF
ncbi:uncharacterized protein [Antedon mediterranea]|uniref:uncharacterized protein isoform X2 n=1 Tax=Antedon mediterranea TaxID=105859 RepID=UPI003AF77462